jgi:hypothetical protein
VSGEKSGLMRFVNPASEGFSGGWRFIFFIGIKSQAAVARQESSRFDRIAENKGVS